MQGRMDGGGMDRRCMDGGGSDGWWVDGGTFGRWDGWTVDGMAPVQLGFPRTSATKEQMSKTRLTHTWSLREIQDSNILLSQGEGILS